MHKKEQQRESTNTTQSSTEQPAQSLPQQNSDGMKYLLENRISELRQSLSAHYDAKNQIEKQLSAVDDAIDSLRGRIEELVALVDGGSHV